MKSSQKPRRSEKKPAQKTLKERRVEKKANAAAQHSAARSAIK